jgi:energy-coupling factor transport system permease protein
VSPGGAPFFYRPLASPLHAARAGVAALWALALVLAAIVLYHPLALLSILGVVVCAAAAAGVGPEMRRALRTASLVGVPIVLVNVLVSRQGLTVFARLGSLGPFGQGDLTVEALVYGAVIALKVTIVILIGTLASLAVNPDELLRIVRRLSFRSALTASLAVRMIPLLAADAQRLAEAQRTRPRAPRGARARIAIIAAVLGGSLDRAMDVAATLEVRGFATARRAPRRPRPWSRHDLAFALSAAAVLGLGIAGAATVPFGAYPRVHAALGAATGVLCLALIAAVALPFCDRRGIDP